MVELVEIVRPTEEPVAVEDLKLALSIDASERDAIIERYIKSARSRFEHQTNRRLLPQTWDWRLDKFPDDGESFELHDGLMPAQSVVHIKYLDTNGVVQTIDSANYGLDAVNLPGYIFPASGYAWPSDVAESANAVTLRVTAGSWSQASDVPEDIWQWIVAHVGTALKAPDGMLVGVSASELPSRYVDGLIDKYRIYRM